jgi:hypothetical protein
VPLSVASALVFALVLVVMVAGAMAGGSGSPGERVGTPWTGEPGNQRTTAAIMAEEQAVGRRATPTLPDLEAHLHKQPNPDSPGLTPEARLGTALAAPQLAVGTSFTGATLADSGFVPPDSMGAVGPSQFLVTVNGRIRVFGKAGAAGALDASLDTFFSTVISQGANVHTTDPRVRYDPLSGKWFVTAIDVNFATLINNRVLLAVSDSGAITNSTVWTFFEFQQDLVSGGGDTNDLADFPTLGIDANALYVGANIFDGSGRFVNSTAFVIRKSSVTGAGPIVVTAFRDIEPRTVSDGGAFTPQGVDNTDPAATEGYFVGVDATLFGKLDLLRVGTPGGTPTLSADLPITVAQTSLPLNPTVAGSSKPLDGIDDRLGSASIRGGKLYTAQNIGVDVSGTASNTPTRDAVRWYELSSLTATPTLSRSGTIYDSSGTATSYWLPSIAVSAQGHAVVGMSTASSSTHPDGAVASMLSGSSSFSTPASYTASSASYSPSFDTGNPYRWGDYSHTSVDPCDGQTFWTIQEYVDSTDSWGVKVGKVPAPPPATPASTSPTSVAAGQSSTNVTLTGSSSSGSGFWDPASGTCRIAAAIDGGVTVNSVTFTDATHLTLNISTVGATAGTRTITITNPDGQTASAAVLAVGTAPANTALPTISGTPAVGSTLTAAAGTWTGTPAPTFAYQWERCDSGGANCADIGGATGTTYLLAQADAGSTIRVRVIGTNAGGSTSAQSAPTAAVTAPPANTAPPTITGLAQVGATLTAANGTWTGFPAPTFTYQWERCDTAGANCVNIASATNQSYVLAGADAGSRIRDKVTGTNSVSAVTAESAATSTITVPPTNTAPPTISGTAAVGSVLTGSDGTWSASPAPTFTYQWRRCDTGGANCGDIAGATANTYTLVQADAGSTIRLRVTAANTGGSNSTDSPATAIVTPAAVAAPSGGGGGDGGGGGGSGGGGGQEPDLHVEVSAEQTTAPPVGSQIIWHITITDHPLTQSAFDVYADVTLPTGFTVTNTYTDRGIGCTAAAPGLVCSLDYIGAENVGRVIIWGTVGQVGAQTLSVRTRHFLADSNPADDSASLTLQPPATPRAPPTGGSTRPLAALTAPAIKGTPQPGSTLHSIPATWTTKPTHVTYQWQLCTKNRCTPIKGATQPTLKITTSDIGHSIRLVATATINGQTVKSASNTLAIRQPRHR